MMNERMKQLMIQCEKKYCQDHDDYFYDMEKFAELIVGECIEVCRRGKFDRKDDLDTIQFDNGIRFCINAIDEHFGD